MPSAVYVTTHKKQLLFAKEFGIIRFEVQKGGANVSGDNNNTAKLITILDYCFVLCVIGLFVEKDHPDVKFHTNQGLLLAIIELCGAVIFSILQFLPYIGGIFGILSALFAVLCVAFSLWGMVHAIREEKKPLPFIGTVFNIVK